MLKKVILMTACLVALLMFSACNDKAVDDVSQPVPTSSTTTTAGAVSKVTTKTKSTTTTASKRTQKKEQPDVAKPSTSQSPQSYEDIVCVETLNYKKVSFSASDSRTAVHVMLPETWVLKSSAKGYDIYRNSKCIGRVSATAPSVTGKAVNVFDRTATCGDVTIVHKIDRVESNNNVNYTRTLHLAYKDGAGKNRSIIISVPYEELDSAAVAKIIGDTSSSKLATEPNMGLLRVTDGRKKILILGNSFVGTSRVGSILQTMCGTRMNVEAYSRGYANVDTYTEDENVMGSIRAGNYSAVFMCGFYFSDSVTDFGAMVNACQASNTKLAIFPAHNEGSTLVNHAYDMYSGVALLDWKSEINHLINGGVSYNDFCMADTHKHSTPLAGYVGAHMIYRAIFNEIPTTTQFSDVSSSEIAKLGSYVSSGTIVFADKSSTYILG